jgi:hypothetical protein
MLGSRGRPGIKERLTLYPRWVAPIVAATQMLDRSLWPAVQYSGARWLLADESSFSDVTILAAS